ncbi:MAG: UDP-N-acetylmuramoyl-L-alanine--D-glutamate ligase, partial [Verrucomicrobia bacterium 21-51-4]
MSWPEAFEVYTQKPIAIFGAGVSGLAAKRLVEHKGGEAWVFDEQCGNPFNPQAAREVGLVILSPGFSPEHPWLKIAHEAHLRILPELDFASVFWPGPLIAITGTNGKSTLTELLCAALKEAHHPAVSVGNIGYALSLAVIEPNELPQTAVCEVSSFQAENLELLTPDALLWTNFSEDHLERHLSLESYFRAKWRLVERLKPGAPCILGAEVARVAQSLNLCLPAKTKVIDFAAPNASRGPQGTVFYTRPQQDNYLLAKAYFEAAGLDLQALERAARSLQLSPHRLQKVATVGGVGFWNDSKGTNFAAVLAALNYFKPNKVLWLGGGKAKGGDIAQFART